MHVGATLAVAREAGDGDAARRGSLACGYAAPYGLYKSTEIIWRAVRKSPQRVLCRQEGRGSEIIAGARAVTFRYGRGVDSRWTQVFN